MKKKRLKRLAIIGGAFILVIVSAILASNYWLIHIQLPKQITAAMQKQWDGPVTIGAINFNWSGPSYLRGVELHDSSGRKWLRAESVKLTLRDWPGLHPVLVEMEAMDIVLKGYFAGGNLQLPIKPAPPHQGKSKYLDLRAITIRNMSVGIAADGNEVFAWDGLQLTVHPDGQIYRIELKRTINEAGEELFTSGTVTGESFEADLNVVMKHTVSPKEAAVILAALNVPFITGADGNLDLNLNFRGRLAGLSSFPALGLSGAIAIADGSMACARGPFMTDLRGKIRFDEQAPPSAVVEWSASFCKGQTKGNLSANAMNDGTVKYRCKVDAQGVNYDEMVKLLSDSQQTRRGELQFIYVLDWRRGGQEESVGRGYLYLEDAHMADVPLLPSLFDFAGLTQFDVLQSTNVEATFTTKDLVITLNKARAANAIAALDAETGGQVDIGKRYLDLYTILAPIKQLHNLLASIPVVKLVVRLQDKLTRVHIRGDWNASAISLMSKEPLQDIEEGAIEFFRGFVSSDNWRLDKTLDNEFDERVAP
jgi:hypothetical protein